MCKQFKAEDILSAKEVYLFQNDTLYVVDHDDEAYGFPMNGSEWYHKANFWDYFDSELMLSYFSCMSKQDAAQLYKKWVAGSAAENRQIEDAVIYAVKHHSGHLHEGTKLPFITHSLETMLILSSMNAPPELMMAGVLHHVIECGGAAENVRAQFGEGVADLVCALGEDKGAKWEERKAQALERLAEADKRTKMLIMADTLACQRTMLRDFARESNELWNRADVPIDKLAWYYSSVQDALYDMQSYSECAAVYWELVDTFKDLFVDYYYICDENPMGKTDEYILSVCADGSAHCLDKNRPEWRDIHGSHMGICGDEQPISRLYAEFMEDGWRADYREKHDSCPQDSNCCLFSSKQRSIDIRISKGCLTMACQDSGPDCELMSGKDEYEFYYELDEDNTRRFLLRLHVEYGDCAEPVQLLRTAFGSDEGSRRFAEFCDRNDIKYRLISM